MPVLLLVPVAAIRFISRIQILRNNWTVACITVGLCPARLLLLLNHAVDAHARVFLRDQDLGVLWVRSMIRCHLRQRKMLTPLFAAEN